MRKRDLLSLVLLIFLITAVFGTGITVEEIDIGRGAPQGKLVINKVTVDSTGYSYSSLTAAIDLTTNNTLNVDYTQLPNTSLSTLEIWALTEKEAKEMGKGFNKNENRDRQFLFQTPYQSGSGIVLKSAEDDAGFSNVPSENPQSKASYKEKRRTEWDGTTLNYYINYIKRKCAACNFYLFVENRIGALWYESEPFKVELTASKETAQLVGDCKTIIECLARIDRERLVQHIFGA